MSPARSFGAKHRPRVLFVGPTALDMQGRPIKQRRLHLPGLTLPMLAALTPDHWDATLVNETVQEIPYDEPWDLVGITGMGSGVVRAWAIADEFRRRGRTVVLGGIAASLLGPEASLRHADSVVLGEAEETWPQAIRDFEGGAIAPVYMAKRRLPIESLPRPRYDLLDRRHLGRWRPVQATRGCPFTCDFCSVTAFFGASYRKRPVDQVIRDVREARKHGTKYIAFIDDNIGVDWDYCTRLWEALIPEEIIWISQCSLHIADRKDMLALAHRSGCRLLSFGIETTNAESLGIHDKAWNRPERYGEAVRTIRKHGIDVSTEMIVGLDGDDEEIFEHIFRFIMDNEITVPRVHIMTPIPGTPLFARMKREGRLLSEDFRRFSGGQVVFRPRFLEPDELQARYWRLYERLFTVAGIWKRVGGNHAGLDRYMRAFILGVNLHYRRHVHHRITPGIV